MDYWSKKYNGKFYDLHNGNSFVTAADELSTDLHAGYVSRDGCRLPYFYPVPPYVVHASLVPSFRYLFEQKAEAMLAKHYQAYGSNKTPFFLYYSMQMVHQPLSAPDAYLARCHQVTGVVDDYETTSEQHYCATIVMMDEAVGNLTCALNKCVCAWKRVLIVRRAAC